MAEPLPMSTEYWRLEMEKLRVRVSKLYNRTVRERVRWQSLGAGLSPDQSPVIMINHDNLLSSFPVAPPPTGVVKSKPS